MPKEKSPQRNSKDLPKGEGHRMALEFVGGMNKSDEKGDPELEAMAEEEGKDE
jgi:hypothetical protein